MGDPRQSDGGLSCLGCGGCLTLFVVVASMVTFAVAGAEWLPHAVAVAVVVAFLIGFIALEKERRR